MADFFGSIEWWRLEPRQDLIQGQSDDWTRKAVAAASARGDLLVVYLPDNMDVRINMSSFVRPMTGRWYFPSTNKWQPIDGDIPGATVRSFTLPTGRREAILVLEVK